MRCWARARARDSPPVRGNNVSPRRVLARRSKDRALPGRRPCVRRLCPRHDVPRCAAAEDFRTSPNPRLGTSRLSKRGYPQDERRCGALQFNRQKGDGAGPDVHRGRVGLGERYQDYPSRRFRPRLGPRRLRGGDYSCHGIWQMALGETPNLPSGAGCILRRTPPSQPSCA